MKVPLNAIRGRLALEEKDFSRNGNALFQKKKQFVREKGEGSAGNPVLWLGLAGINKNLQFGFAAQSITSLYSK